MKKKSNRWIRSLFGILIVLFASLMFSRLNIVIFILIVLFGLLLIIEGAFNFHTINHLSSKYNKH